MTEKTKTPTNDKRTIGITSANEKNLAALVLAGNFGSELDAAKFALAYAIRNDASAGTAEGTNTKWNIGTVDSDGSLKSVVEAVFDGVAEPYRLIEYLINEGLTRLGSDDAIPPDVVGILFQANQQGLSQDKQHGKTE